MAASCVRPFNCYVTPWGGGVSFPGKKRYEGVRFNVISVTMGWVGVKFPEKQRYVTLEWPPCRHNRLFLPLLFILMLIFSVGNEFLRFGEKLGSNFVTRHAIMCDVASAPDSLFSEQH